VKTALTEAKQLTHTQRRILALLEFRMGEHILGPDLAAACHCTPRTLRQQIRSLRLDHNGWDILSHAGNNPQTDGYWISADPAEIEANREYHRHQGLDHLSRASHMTPKRTAKIDQATGQALMDFVDTQPAQPRKAYHAI